MERRLQLRVQRYGWDAAASHYADVWEGPLAPAHDTLVALADPRGGAHALEVACGTGLVTHRLAAAVGPDGTVLATDLSDEMVESTAASCHAAGLGQVRAARMNAERLDVADGAFDLAVCALGLMYVPDPVAALAEMRRAVRAGGRVVATVWGERRHCGWADIFPIVDARVASEVCPVFFGLGAPGALLRAFTEAGMSGGEERRERRVLRFADAEALLTAVLLGGPVAMAVKRFTPAEMDAVRAEFLASVARYRQQDGSYTVPGEFVTVAAEASG